MKQKLIWAVLVTITLYLPANSRENGKVTVKLMAEPPVACAAASETPVTATSFIPASPISHLLFNL